jgi:hypothetical protein
MTTVCSQRWLSMPPLIGWADRLPSRRPRCTTTKSDAVPDQPLRPRITLEPNKRWALRGSARLVALPTIHPECSAKLRELTGRSGASPHQISGAHP